MIKLIIPGEPMGKQRGRTFIHNVTGKSTTLTPEKTVNYETLVKELYIINFHRKQLEGQLQMTVRAFFSIPKSTPKNKITDMIFNNIRPIKKPDWDNVGKIVSDALNGLAYHDDSQIVAATVEKYYSTNPRTEVEIEEL